MAALGNVERNDTILKPEFRTTLAGIGAEVEYPAVEIAVGIDEANAMSFEDEAFDHTLEEKTLADVGGADDVHMRSEGFGGYSNGPTVSGFSHTDTTSDRCESHALIVFEGFFKRAIPIGLGVFFDLPREKRWIFIKEL